MWLRLIRIEPWWLAVFFAASASVLDACGLVILRRATSRWTGLACIACTNLVSLLSVAELTPLLMSACGGAGMVTVVTLSLGPTSASPRWTYRIAAFLIFVGAIAIAFDTHVVPSPTGPDAILSGPKSMATVIFWLLVAVFAVIGAVAAGVSRASPRPPMWTPYGLILGTANQSVVSIAVAYLMMTKKGVIFLPVLLASGLYEMWLLERSLMVNPVERHAPCVYALWQLGVLASGPCVTGLTQANGWLTALGVLLCVCAAGSICRPHVGS